MTSLLDRPITAAKLWQTHAIKYEITEIKFDLHCTAQQVKTY